MMVSEKRCGKTLHILQEYEKAQNDGKNVLLVDKKQFTKELLGLETHYDKLFEQWRKLNE